MFCPHSTQTKCRNESVKYHVSVLICQWRIAKLLYAMNSDQFIVYSRFPWCQMEAKYRPRNVNKKPCPRAQPNKTDRSEALISDLL